MAHDDQDRITAFAGMFQAVASVVRIARTGSADVSAMEPCIYSLFQVDADDVTAVYGAPGAVANGARQVIAQLTGRLERDLELTRCVVSVLKLERSLSARPDLLARIGEGIEAANEKREHFPLLHPNVLAHFADLYSEVLSRLSPRILVRGVALHLQNPDNQHRIRALLLAAVRSALLWRQIGGNRWQILFGRKRLLAEARHYLDQAGGPQPADPAPRDNMH
ncbi:high frequency lysogenization protein HflD [uncultured Lamprocystis sp.]|jgi:high frequency lysogenization protein|uniref:high frequency lysogenization protein HflD n=1 Tax=uncultured Lamprocystis sp. TaxID=543132 RepID=UPI0025DB7E29|nr:high frequency lysogenization protein HflD [uncultured Lamprocystis sp.]